MKLDELVKNGQACLIEAPRTQDQWGQILRQIGTAYCGSPLEALKEFCSNSSDGDAKTIDIHIDRAHRQIRIEDDGKGMYLPEAEKQYVNTPLSAFGTVSLADNSILRLPKSIGESAKKGTAMQGEKAIGALAWQIFGDKATFISRYDGKQTVAWACQHTEKNLNHYYQSTLIDGATQPDLKKLRNTHGTTVVLDAVTPEALKVITPGNLQRDLSSRFRDWLIKGSTIHIHEGRKVYTVLPEEFTGAKLVAQEVPGPLGPTHVELYCSPTIPGQLHLKHKIQTLVSDFGRQYKGHLGSDAWGSGIIVGQIRADYLRPTAARQDFDLTHESAKQLFEILQTYTPMVEKAVEEARKACSDTAKDHLYTQLSRALVALANENPDANQLLSAYGVTKTGEACTGSIGKGLVFVPTGTWTEGDGGRHRRKPSKPTETRPYNDNGSTHLHRKPGIGIMFEDRDLNSPALSAFEDNYLVVFNSGAPEYAKAMASADSKAQYFAGLTAKELLNPQYKNARDLCDKVLTLQGELTKYFKKVV